MAQLNPKTLPVPSDLEGYSNCRADFEIWEMFTDLEKKKRGPAVFLSLTGQARECVRALGLKNRVDLPTPLVWLGEPCYATDSRDVLIAHH